MSFQHIQFIFVCYQYIQPSFFNLLSSSCTPWNQSSKNCKSCLKAVQFINVICKGQKWYFLNCKTLKYFNFEQHVLEFCNRWLLLTDLGPLKHLLRCIFCVLHYDYSLSTYEVVSCQVGKNYVCSEWKQELITFSQFLDRMSSTVCPSNLTYLAQHPLFEQVADFSC